MTNTHLFFMRILNQSGYIRGLGDIVSCTPLLPCASCESHQVNPVCGLVFTTKLSMLEITRFTNWNQIHFKKKKKLLLSHIKVVCKYLIPQDQIPLVIIHSVVARRYREKTQLGCSLSFWGNYIAVLCFKQLWVVGLFLSCMPLWLLTQWGLER